MSKLFQQLECYSCNKDAENALKCLLQNMGLRYEVNMTSEGKWKSVIHHIKTSGSSHELSCTLDTKEEAWKWLCNSLYGSGVWHILANLSPSIELREKWIMYSPSPASTRMSTFDMESKTKPDFYVLEVGDTVLEYPIEDIMKKRIKEHIAETLLNYALKDLKCCSRAIVDLTEIVKLQKFYFSFKDSSTIRTIELINRRMTDDIDLKMVTEVIALHFSVASNNLFQSLNPSFEVGNKLAQDLCEKFIQ